MMFSLSGKDFMTRQIFFVLQEIHLPSTSLKLVVIGKANRGRFEGILASFGGPHHFELW